MINRELRTRLVDQFHALIAEFTSNYEFDQWLDDKDFDAQRDPRFYHDAAIGPT